MRFTLNIDLSNTAAQTLEDIKIAIVASINRAGRDGNGTLANVEVCPPWQIQDANGHNVGQWEVVPDMLTKASAPAFVCCCGATDTPAPTMPGVLAMPTAAELAQQQQLGAMATPGADDHHRGVVASMASVAGMAWLPTAGELSGSGVAAESPRENIADRITADGSIAAAAGPTGSPRRRNLASRPTKSQLVDTIVADYLANGKDAAVATFDTAQDLHNLTNEESKSIVLMVRNRLGERKASKKTPF